jgi:non-homologous end joining protein Ku
VRQKANGHTVEAAPSPERADNVINLMDALRQNLPGRKRRPAKAGRARKTA